MIIVGARVDWDSITHEYAVDIDADRSCHVCVDKNGIVVGEVRTKLSYKPMSIVLTRESAIALRDCLRVALEEPRKFEAWTWSSEGFEYKAEGFTKAIRDFISSRI